jgi:hypothetical protein
VSAAAPAIDPIAVLVEALNASNPYYSTGLEAARLEAAEILMTHPSANADARDRARAFLEKIVNGKDPSAGMIGRVRAAKILLGPSNNFADNLQAASKKPVKETK